MCFRVLPCASLVLLATRLKLKPSLSWADVKIRLDREFDPDDPRRQDLYESQLRSAKVLDVLAKWSRPVANK